LQVSGYCEKLLQVHLSKKVMRHFVLLIFLSVTAVMCDSSKYAKPQQTFHSFDFSYNNVFSTCFSIKFTESDTVFIRQHFASAFSDTPKSNTSYFAVLTSNDRTKLDSLINQTNFTGFDSLYYQSYEDGIDYQFYLEQNGFKKLIRVHSDSVPTQLAELKNWIVEKKKALLLHRIDTTIHFESTKSFLPPTVPAPPLKFKNPKVE
jgi:hypothetical protein